jgi:EAL domain-containing protein (putative c-di-GMP-specific phosphodiesterase class I)
VSASIGVAPLAGSQHITAEQALINADLAMYDAKEAGRNRFETYDFSSTAKAGIQARLEWVELIRTALEEDLFTLYAQPVVEAATGQTTQLELLIRMIGPENELIMPAAFLPIAERFGLINEIDHWVVTHTIKLLATQSRRGVRPTVEINLSGHSLTDPDLADHIATQLRGSNVDPKQLVFEVTETAAITNIEAAQHFAEQLAKLGCRFALDDFGAGFGSFYYLKHLPFDFIKIDGEFIRQLVTDPTDRLVVSAVVDLARGLGKRTIAEFVGDEATVASLRVLGVDYLQGYHLGKPAPVESWLPAAPSPSPVTAAL